MPLVDWEIEAALLHGDIRISNLQPDAIQPNSIDLHAGEDAIVPRGRMVLTHTLERVYLGPGYCAQILLCSTAARLGLDMAKAQHFDEGFEGDPTIELMYWGDPGAQTDYREVPFGIPQGWKFCQLIITRTAVAALPYGHPSRRSRYQGQSGTTVARPDPRDQGS